MADHFLSKYISTSILILVMPLGVFAGYSIKPEPIENVFSKRLKIGEFVGDLIPKTCDGKKYKNIMKDAYSCLKRYPKTKGIISETIYTKHGKIIGFERLSLNVPSYCQKQKNYFSNLNPNTLKFPYEIYFKCDEAKKKNTVLIFDKNHKEQVQFGTYIRGSKDGSFDVVTSSSIVKGSGVSQAEGIDANSYEKGRPISVVLSKATISDKMSNLPEVLQSAQAKPVADSAGKMTGSKMLKIKPGSVYEYIQLSVGDVLYKVNGEVIDSAQKSMSLLQLLKNSQPFVLTVIRSQQLMDIKYEFAK